VRQGLGDRQTEPLGETGHQQRPGAAQQCGQPRVGHRSEFDNMPSQRATAIQQIQHILVLPPTLSDNQQSWGAFPMVGDQAPPDVQQQQMVLARLDRADAQEIRPVARRRGDAWRWW
jgi:hypothetical protein